MSILVTGSAGFIGYHLCKQLLAEGHQVIGVDNMNDYYTPALKQDRNSALEHVNFTFYQHDIAADDFTLYMLHNHKDITHIIHLAAQAGVRYSIENPHVYMQSNIVGHLNVLELARNLPNLEHLVYASSSSVYGENDKLPFSTDDDVSKPVSLYAATKRADELMSYTYSHLYGIPATGLRFFTVYGPWGRPDMAAWKFTNAILRNQPITIYNHGDMQRDFTYIDDIISGVLAATKTRPDADDKGVAHTLYNLGNNNSEKLMSLVKAIEHATGITAIKEYDEIQPGDVKATYADIESSRKMLNFAPKTSLAEGIPLFVEWFKHYHQL